MRWVGHAYMGSIGAGVNVQVLGFVGNLAMLLAAAAFLRRGRDQGLLHHRLPGEDLLGRLPGWQAGHRGVEARALLDVRGAGAGALGAGRPRWGRGVRDFRVFRRLATLRRRRLRRGDGGARVRAVRARFARFVPDPDGVRVRGRAPGAPPRFRYVLQAQVRVRVLHASRAIPPRRLSPSRASAGYDRRSCASCSTTS